MHLQYTHLCNCNALIYTAIQYIYLYNYNTYTYKIITESNSYTAIKYTLIQL